MSRATWRRRLLNPNRCPLQFTEQQINGSTHHYGPQLRSAVNPRLFVSERSQHGVPERSWVSPQFNSLEETTVKRNRQRKKKNQSPTSTLNRTSSSTQARRLTACKYPALLFNRSNSVLLRSHRGVSDQRTVLHERDTPENRTSENHIHGTISPVSCSDSPRLISAKTTVCNAGISVNPHITRCDIAPEKPTTPGSDISTPEGNHLLTPHVKAVEIPLGVHADSSSALSLLFSPNQQRTPQISEKLLVRDTPECDYGLKVTWRRRKKLMRLLTERGQLLNTETLISDQ